MHFSRAAPASASPPARTIETAEAAARVAALFAAFGA
jgi:hypothetical protein